MRKKALATGIAGLILPAILHGALVQSTITGSGNLNDLSSYANWHTASNWSPAVVPNNNNPGGNFYAATVSGGVVHRAAPTPTTLDALSIGANSRLFNEGGLNTLKLNTSLGGVLINSGAGVRADNVDNRGVITAINSTLLLSNVRNEGSIISGPGSSIDVITAMPGFQPGTFTADRGSLRLVSVPTIHGNIAANNGSVQLGGTLNGRADIYNGSYLDLFEANIVGQLYTQNAKVIVHPFGKLNLFSPFENNGEIHVTASSSLTLFPSNPVNVNNGHIYMTDSKLQLANGDDVQLEYVLNGGGTLHLGGGRITNQEFGNTVPMLVNGPQHTIEGPGMVDLFTLNRGTIKAGNGVAFLAGFENQGELKVGQGTVVIAGGWRNLNSGTLSGGSYTIDSGGRLVDVEDGVLVTNATHILLRGKADILRHDGGSAFQTLQHNQDTLALEGAFVNAAPDFTNTGSLFLANGSFAAGLGIPGARFRQTTGISRGFGFSSIAAETIEVAGGFMEVPRLYGNVLQTGGMMQTGPDRRILEIFGGFTQKDGLLQLTLRAPDMLDLVLISGHASLDGLLGLVVADTFPHAPLDPFQLIAWASHSGRFRNITMPQLDGLKWFVDYRPNGLYLSLNPVSTPEPATFLLSGIVLAAAGLWRRRRAAQ